MKKNKNKIQPEKSKELYKKYKGLVEQFLKPDKKIEWGREIKLAQYLLNNYTETIFKDWDLGFRLNSLAYFRTIAGLASLEDRINYLKRQKQNSLSVIEPKPKIYKIEEKKIDEDKILSSCNKNMLDFLG